MYKRSLDSLLNEALIISPVVLLSGARQVGKSTLALNTKREYRVFDSLNERSSALEDPMGYIASLPKPITLDEIQKVPHLLDSIKYYVDKDRKNGTYLLTGSANVLDMKETKESLAGRIIEITLWPFSQKELANKSDQNVVDILLKTDLSKLVLQNIENSHIYSAILDGGLPEVLQIQSKRGKALWFDSYISTYVERDIRDIGELRDISAFIKLYNIIAPRSCALLNKSDLANDTGVSEATLSNYLTMLQMIYQISQLEAYHSNISKRFIKSPKLYMNDSGVLCHLLGITSSDELLHSNKKGEVIETFVFSELLKHVSYSESRPKLYHYRTNDKKEIDFIIEKGEKILAIEVKSSTSVSKEAFKHIIDFQNKSSSTVVGIVLYMGENLLSFGDEKSVRYAVPMGVFF
jgi:uncharacterized protein